MPIVDVEQQSPEWLKMRIGCATGSRVTDIVTKLKSGKYSAARDKYLMDIVIERLTGRATEHFCTPAMEFGIENEPAARAAYEGETGNCVMPVGLAIHPTIEWFSASPDGLVGDDGLIEIKVPNTSTHLEYLLEGKVPLDYMPQMMAEMACTERQWCDFVSYDPRLPKNLQLFIRRFHRNEELIRVMEADVKFFLEEVLLKMGELANHAEARGLEQASPVAVSS